MEKTPQADHRLEAKKLCKEYGKAKEKIAYIERRYGRILDYAGVDTENDAKGGVVCMDKQCVARFCKRDQEIVQAYLEAKRVAFLLETAVAALPEGIYKSILMESVLSGGSVESVMQKYGVSRATYFRAKQKMLWCIAEWLCAREEIRNFALKSA